MSHDKSTTMSAHDPIRGIQPCPLMMTRLPCRAPGMWPMADNHGASIGLAPLSLGAAPPDMCCATVCEKTACHTPNVVVIGPRVVLIRCALSLKEKTPCYILICEKTPLALHGMSRIWVRRLPSMS